MNDLWSSLCGKHEIKSCPIWQGEWVCLVPARRFYYFKLFCHLRSCMLPGLPVLGSCSQLIKMANAGDESWIFLSNLAESSWIFKVQPQTCRHLQPTHCLSLIRMVWRWSNSGAYYRKEPCLGIKGRAVSSVTSQTHIYQSGSNMSVRWFGQTSPLFKFEYQLKGGPVRLISDSTGGALHDSPFKIMLIHLKLEFGSRWNWSWSSRIWDPEHTIILWGDELALQLVMFIYKLKMLRRLTAESEIVLGLNIVL